MEEGIADYTSDIYSFGKTFQTLLSYTSAESKEYSIFLKVLNKCCAEKKEARYKSIEEVSEALDLKKSNRKKRILYILVIFSICVFLSFALFKHIKKKNEANYMKFMQNTNYQEAVKIFPDREVTYIEAFDFFSNSQKDALSELEHLIQISDTKNIEIYKFLFYKYLEKDEMHYYRKAKQILINQLKECKEYVHYVSVVSMLAYPYPLTKQDTQKSIQDLKQIETDINNFADKRLLQDQLLWLYQVYYAKEEVFQEEAFIQELQIIEKLKNTLYDKGLTKTDILQMKAESLYRQGLYYQRQENIQDMKKAFYETLKIEDSLRNDVIFRIKASMYYILTGYESDKSIDYLKQSIRYLRQIKQLTRQDEILEKEVKEKLEIWGITYVGNN